MSNSAKLNGGKDVRKPEQVFFCHFGRENGSQEGLFSSSPGFLVPIKAELSRFQGCSLPLFLALVLRRAKKWEEYWSGHKKDSGGKRNRAMFRCVEGRKGWEIASVLARPESTKGDEFPLPYLMGGKKTFLAQFSFAQRNCVETQNWRYGSLLNRVAKIPLSSIRVQ